VVFVELVCPKCSAKFGSPRDSGAVACPQCGSSFRAEAQSDTIVVTPRPTAGAPPLDVREAAPPPTFARYVIEKVIGRGGMGVVYKAHDPELKRTVALKVLLAADHASSEEIQRFFREAESAAKLQHPNIVPIHELSVHAGKHYYTMDLIEGAPLDEIIDGEKLKLREGMAMLEKVARGLSHAHVNGIVHRDLKPANIIVGLDGEPKITDFGLAKIVQPDADAQSSPRLTISGVAMGTPHYMAPEQAAGRSHQVDARSDIYSLGCIMYELMTGSPPFVAEGAMEVLRKQVEEDPVSPAQRGARASVDAETICLKCLEKEPARRYQSAAELADDIRRFLDGEPVTARRASMAYLLRKKLLRYKAIAAVIAAATLALVGATAWYVLDLRDKQGQIRHQRDKALRQKRIAEQREREARAAERRAQQQEARAKFQVYRYGIAEAHRLSAEKFYEDALDVLLELPAEHRGWEYYHLLRKTRLGRYPPLWIHKPMASIQSVAFSPDGRLLAVASGRGNVEVRETASGKRRIAMVIRERGGGGPLAGMLADVRAVTFDPSGRQVAVATFKGSITIREVKTGKQTLLLRGTSSSDTLKFSADGKRLIAGGVRVRVWDLAARKPVMTLPRGKAQNNAVLSPDGKRLATGSADGKVRIWDLATGRELLTMTGDVGMLLSLAWSPAGKYLAASGTRSGGLKVWDVSSGRLRMHLARELKKVFSVDFSPDGKLLVAGIGDNTVRLWDLLPGRPLMTLFGWGNVAFSPDGKILVAGGPGLLKAWSVQRGWAAFRLKAHAGPIQVFSLSRDGKRLVTSTGSEVKLWGLPGYRILRTWKEPRRSAAVFLRFSPYGKLLAQAGADGRLKIIDPKTAGVLRNFKASPRGVSACAWNPGGRRVAVTGWMDSYVRIFDAYSGKQVRELAAFEHGSATLAWSPDGRRLVAGGRSGNPGVLLWDLLGDARPQKLEGHKGSIDCLTFSRDGKLLASSGWDRQVMIWDAASGKRRKVLSGHVGAVRGLAFGAQGRRLASGSDDMTVRLWDIASGDQMLVLKGRKSGFTWLEFSPDGRKLLACDEAGIVRIWVADRPKSPNPQPAPTR
jgi:WD40 repeat protein